MKKTTITALILTAAVFLPLTAYDSVSEKESTRTVKTEWEDSNSPASDFRREINALNDSDYDESAQTTEESQQESADEADDANFYSNEYDTVSSETEEAASILNDQYDPTQETVEEYVLSSLSYSENTPVIDLSNGLQEAKNYFDSISMSCPSDLVLIDAGTLSYNTVYFAITRDCFWIDQNTYSDYTGEHSIGGYIPVIVVHFTYHTTDPAQITSKQNEIAAVRNEVLAKIPAGADCWTKAKIIHDDLVVRLTYDQSISLPYIRSLYAMVTGDAVCVGYAEVFSYLMEQAGEAASVVVSDDESHCWKYLDSFPGNDTYIDVTWDDPDVIEPDGAACIQYDYFGLTYEELNLIDSHYKQFDYSTYYNNPDVFNYNKRTGSYFDSYNYEAIRNAFAVQYAAGSSNLSIRFSNFAAYQDAMGYLLSNNCEILNQMINEIGFQYGDCFYYNYNDNTLCFEVVA